MTGVVVDASVSAAWFLPAESTPFTEAALQATTTAEVWVPALWLIEIGNLLLSAERRKRIGAAKRSELVEAADRLQLNIDREPVSMTRIDSIASRLGLTAFDAAYLELALRRSLPLASVDAALIAALAPAGVQAFRPDLSPPL